MEQFQYDNFQSSAIKIDKKFFSILKTLRLDCDWKVNNSFEIEIKKSFIKSVIRYSDETKILLDLIVKNFAKKNSNNFRYTNLYPMIHLCNDQVESGGYHFDQVDKNKLITLWIAISQYEYAPLSILNFNLKNVLLNKIFIKSKMPEYFSKKIYLNQGDLNMWDGTFIHSGNLNSSNKPAMALQMKILPKSEDFVFEDTINFSKEKREFSSKNDDFLNYIESYNFFKYFVDNIKNFSDEEKNLSQNLKKITKFIRDNFQKPHKEFSFSLSILSQRIRSFKHFYFSKIKNIEQFVLLLDYASIIIGSENLVSYKRLNLNKNNLLLKSIVENDLFNFYKLKKEKISLIIESF